MLLFKTNAGEVSAALRQIAREYPRQYPAVLSTIGLGLRKKIVESLPRGTTPLSFKPYNQFTLLLKARKKKSFRSLYSRSKAWNIKQGLKTKKNGDLTKASINKLARRSTLKNKVQERLRKAGLSGFGGRLREKELLRFTKSERGFEKSVFVGYLNDRLSGLAKKFQSSGTRALTRKERAFRHSIQGKNIDSSYRRPAREIFKPMATSAEIRDYILRVAKGRLESILKKEAAKVGAP